MLFYAVSKVVNLAQKTILAKKLLKIFKKTRLSKLFLEFTIAAVTIVKYAICFINRLALYCMYTTYTILHTIQCIVYTYSYIYIYIQILEIVRYVHQIRKKASMSCTNISCLLLLQLDSTFTQFDDTRFCFVLRLPIAYFTFKKILNLLWW